MTYKTDFQVLETFAQELVVNYEYYNIHLYLYLAFFAAPYYQCNLIVADRQTKPVGDASFTLVSSFTRIQTYWF